MQAAAFRCIVAAIFLTIPFATALQAQSQTNPPTGSGRVAPVGHRQPTAESVGSALSARGTNAAPQPQSQNRDFGSELSICRGC